MDSVLKEWEQTEIFVFFDIFSWETSRMWLSSVFHPLLPHQSFQVATHLPTWQGCIKNCNDILSSFWRSNKNTTARSEQGEEPREWEGISRGGSIFSIKVDLCCLATLKQKILSSMAAFILLRFFDAAAEGLANYNELINMLHTLIINARSVNSQWFIWGLYAIFGLIFSDWVYMLSIIHHQGSKDLRKWDFLVNFPHCIMFENY